MVCLCGFASKENKNEQLPRSAHYKENSRSTGKVDVKWTVDVAVVTEDPADRSMIRSMDVFQKIWRIAGHTGFQTNRHGVYTNA